MLGLGCLDKDCDRCAGVGYVAEVVEPVKRKRASRAKVKNKEVEICLNPQDDQLSLPRS
jgi:hypothetical protein